MPTSNHAPSQRFRFADLTMDLGQRRLLRGNDEIPLSRLSFEVLRVLVEASPNLVTHDALAEGVWGTKRIVTPDNLAKRALLLRQALGDGVDEPRYFETVRGQGYRLIPAVERVYPDKSASVAGAASPSTPRAWFSAMSVAAVLLAITGLAAALLLLDLGAAPPPPAVVRFELRSTTNSPLVLSRYARSLAVSPDGSRIAYGSSEGAIVVRSLDRIDPIRLAQLGTDSRSPTFSPDDKFLAYFDGPVLKRVDIGDAGSIETIAEIGQFTDGDLHWASDGTILVATSRGIQRIPAEGGTPELLAVPNPTQGERAFNAPSLLPDERTILFSIEPTRPQAGSRVAVLDIASGKRTYLINGTQPTYVPSGHLVFVADRALHAVTLDLARLEVGAEVLTLAEGLVVNSNGTAQVGVSASGTLVYATGGTPDISTLIWVDRDGHEEPLTAPSMSYTYPRLSPDGRRIALDARWPESDIWVWDLEREVMTRITNDPAENVLPVWHPGGRLLAFGDGRGGAANVYLREVDGGRPAEPMLASDRRQIPFSTSPDGRYLLYGQAEQSGPWQMHLYDLDEQSSRPLLTDGAYIYLNTDVSPDGRWVVYQSNESGRFEIYVRPFPDTTAGRWQISRSGGSKPMWGKDGAEIFYIDPDRKLMAVEIATHPTLSAGRATPVLDLSRYMSTPYDTGARPYDLSLDGQRFLIPRDIEEIRQSAEPRIVVTVNWTQILEQRLAAK